MRRTTLARVGAGLLALAALAGPRAGTAQAQVGYYAPAPVVRPSAYATGPYRYAYPGYARSAPNPGIGGNGYHYGYYPARRELPLYKPWLRRD